MKKLRIYLLCDYLYYTVLILAIIYAGITLFVEQPLKRDGEELKFKGIITSIKIDGNKLELVIKGKLKVLGYHYFKTKENKDLFLIKYSIGDQVLFNGTLEKPTTNRNFNLFNYQNYLKSKKIKYLYKVISYEKLNNKKKLLYKIKSRIYTQIKKSPKSKGYLYALVLGDKTKMSNEIKKSYQKNGISHLFAISGMHIGFLVLSILKILKYTSISMRKQHYILFAILISYLFLTGFSPSIFRAVVFFILLGINKVFYLYIKRINIFFITLSLLLVYNPFFVYDLGFKLSFAITFFLIIFSENINIQKTYFLKLFIISLIAFLAAMPILINNFFELNFLSPFLNLIFVPLLSLIIYPFSLLTLIFPIFDNTLANVLDLFENMSLIFNNITYIKFTFAKVSTPILFLYYLLIYLLIKKVSFKNILFFLILLFFHNNINVFNPESYLLFFDVGQGNAALLKLPYNQGIVLIDTGGKLSFEQAEWKKRENTYQLSDYVILPFLKSEGIKKIDYLVLTHGDIDHLGESINIINNIPVKNVFLNSNNLNNLESGIINELKLKNIDYEQIEKKEIVIRNNYIFFKSYNYSNENDSSIITYLNINNKKILLMGDASLAIEKKLVTDYNIKNINLLEIGHHGSKTSSGKKFIDIVNPKKAVISSGKNNFYGHPHQEVIDLLLNNNIDVYRTDRQGSIKYTFRNSGTIRTVLP